MACVYCNMTADMQMGGENKSIFHKKYKELTPNEVAKISNYRLKNQLKVTEQKNTRLQ